VEIIDPVEDYVMLMKEIFDFQVLRDFFGKNPSFKMLFNGMHGGNKSIS
jgi:phosphoglucomutase